MRINEIFYSIQGEGIYQGIPMVFIRVAGCNLLPKCRYCDTRYAWSPENGKDMNIEDIVDEVDRFSPYLKSWVCITGGEPLWQEDELEKLVRELKKKSYLITIETNGSFEPPRWYTLVDSWNADIKCPSSGVCGVSKEEWFRTRYQDQIKFVVGDIDDLNFTKEVIGRNPLGSPQILISPVSNYLIDKRGGKIEEYWNKEWLKEVAEFCKKERARLSLQIHKIIWGEIRGV
jgi:7-carboxy-7-deazaguanine synthase